MSLARRPPISARHAFALAFDLAVRRDALQSLVVPLLLRTPWILTLALLPGGDEGTPRTRAVLLLMCAALLGDYFVSLIIAAMLRFRARTVYNTPPGSHPGSVLGGYQRALRRLPWLVVTEALRNGALFAAGFFLVLPALWVGFRLSMATEAVVLRGGTAMAAFSRSFQLTDGRFERWLEMIVGSVFLVLGVWFAAAFLYFAFPGPGVSVWASIGLFLLAGVTPVIQYAWTFFYLRLEEAEAALEVGVMAPAAPPPPLAPRGGWSSSPHGESRPRLRLVEVAPESGKDEGD